MKKVFLSTSFSGKVDAASGAVQPMFRTFIEQILAVLRQQDLEVFCAVEDEGWLISATVPPEVGVQKDLEVLDGTDVLLALVDTQPSAGVQFELGYAVAKGKQVILACHRSDKLAYFNQGAVSAGHIMLINFDNPTELVKQLTVALHAPADELQRT
jgi:nucleoside 2-deoxyribosyltransferase